MADLKERSRSRSRRARLEEAKRGDGLERSESMASLMRSGKYSNTPNQLALKQRYQHSKMTFHKSDSPQFDKGKAADLPQQDGY